VQSAGAPAPNRRSLLDLGRRGRLAFAVLYVVVMLVVVIGAQHRPDHVFGFQMFNETSTLTIRLYRRVHGSKRNDALPDGTFRTRAPDGSWREIRWNDRVHDPVLGKLERPVHAKYGLAGQLFRLQLALDDFVAHLADDRETEAIIAVVQTLKNGRSPAVVRLKAVRP